MQVVGGAAWRNHEPDRLRHGLLSVEIGFDTDR